MLFLVTTKKHHRGKNNYNSRPMVFRDEKILKIDLKSLEIGRLISLFQRNSVIFGGKRHRNGQDIITSALYLKACQVLAPFLSLKTVRNIFSYRLISTPVRSGLRMMKDFDEGLERVHGHTWLVSKWVGANHVTISESILFLRFDQSLALRYEVVVLRRIQFRGEIKWMLDIIFRPRN